MSETPLLIEYLDLQRKPLVKPVTILGHPVVLDPLVPPNVVRLVGADGSSVSFTLARPTP